MEINNNSIHEYNISKYNSCTYIHTHTYHNENTDPGIAKTIIMGIDKDALFNAMTVKQTLERINKGNPTNKP